MSLTVVDNGLLSTDAQYTGFKSKIINGAMAIDQRRAGASATVTGANEAYTVDRFFASKDTSAGTFTVQQTPSATETGFATRVAAGFTNYTAITIGTAWTAASGDGATFQQRIEGLNISDLAWGTANAKTVTLSFLVYSSLTGTFSGSLTNSAVNRSYPYSYSIPVANTWTQISITIAGDQSGTWLTTNGVGVRVYWDLGSGSTFLGTANAWTGSLKVGVTGSVALSPTAAATFYITGVQLEKGSTATSFDYRPYGTELALCQRYFQTVANGPLGSGSTTQFTFGIVFPVQMRAAPSGAVTAPIRITDITTSAFTQSSGSITSNLVTPEGGSFHLPNFTGMTANRPALLAQSSSGTIQLSAEI